MVTRAAELAQLQHELASAKAKRDLEIAERDHTLETLKKDNAVLKERLERRSQERADHYESRSYERKDNSEMAKYIPAMVVAVAAGIAYFMKS
jgi:Skp family chaperone for outer membrane proteins